MPVAPKVSVVIPWSNRDELRVSLDQNKYWIVSHQAEVIIVNCGGSTEQFHGLLRPAPFSALRGIDIPEARFNKSLALNIGLSYASTPIVFILDADVILKSDLLAKAIPCLENRVFITVDRVQETGPPALSHEMSKKLRESLSGGLISDVYITTSIEFKLQNARHIRQRIYRQSQLDASRAGAGQLIARKQHLLDIGGYDSDLKSWGWEDNDVELRLVHALGLHHVEMGCAFHMSHADDKRALDGRSRAESSFENLKVLCKKYSCGDFSGTYSADISLWKNRAVEI